MNEATLTLYYDGLCPLCSREVAHYRRCAAGDPSVHFIDISDPAFDAAAHGLDTRRIHQVMHVREGEQLLLGVDAFLAIWRRIPGHRWLSRLAALPGMHTLLRGTYFLFAHIRPWLPRRRSACTTGVCRR
jgi:predicted DCC family thiol-disulfide oxidoreductase YuxK